MGITDEEEGGRTFLFSAHFFCREENVDYGEVCGGFSMQALECFGVSGDGLSAWRVLAGANCCQQCIT